MRRQGRTPEDAEDLVQEFFARLLQKEFLRAVEPERGRFRTFLVMALKRMMANEWDRANAQKRGGREKALPPQLATPLLHRGHVPMQSPGDFAIGRRP